MDVKIIGNGSWGSALFEIVKEHCSTVSFWKKDEVITGNTVIIISVPTQAIREILNFIQPHPEIIIINTAKGIEHSTNKLPYQIITEKLGNSIHYFSLIGPSFAEEVKRKEPTLVNLGYITEAYKDEMRELFHTSYFDVELTKSVQAIELAGAFKNIYAIVCGLADGLGFGINTQIKLVIKAYEELSTLFTALKFRVDSNDLPGTMGDLILSCRSSKSRNYAFGKLIAQYGYTGSMKQMPLTLEGIYTARSVSYFRDLTKMPLSLASFSSSILSIEDPDEIKRMFIDFIYQ